MEFTDYYKVLGVSRTSSELELKASYRKLARKYHPDLNLDNEETSAKFQELNEAYEVLGNPENRKKYDRRGKDWKNDDDYRIDYNHFENSRFSESIFGNDQHLFNQTQYPEVIGQDYNSELHLNLEDVYVSLEQILMVNGEKIRLIIPAGIENNQIIKIKGLGGQGINGGANGDLYVKFNIHNHTEYDREGHDLYKKVDLNIHTAILGGEIIIDTLHGKVQVKIAPETKNGSKVILKGVGFPVYKEEQKFGDLIITFQITVPDGFSEEEIIQNYRLNSKRADLIENWQGQPHIPNKNVD